MTFHRHPINSRHDLAEDIRAYVHQHSDNEAKLSSLERLSALDLTVLALAFQDMENDLNNCAVMARA